MSRRRHREIEAVSEKLWAERTPRGRTRLQGIAVPGGEVMPTDEEIVRDLHLGYTGGRVSPRIVRGITFFIVGHNASHEFYLGHDQEGQLWIRSYGETGEIDEHGIPMTSERISRVTDINSIYIGHH